MVRFHYNELVSVKLQSDEFLYVISTNADGHLVCRVEITSDTKGNLANTQVVLRSDQRAFNKNRLKTLKMGAYCVYPTSTSKLDFYHTEQVPEGTGETGYIFLSN